MPKITGTGHVSFKRTSPAAPAVEQEEKVTPTPPAPQAGVAKWLAYAEDVGIEVPEESRDDKAAIRALVNK